MNRLWTEEEDAIIRADSAARVPRPVTAARLGRPVHATRNRALKLGQIIQVHTPWSAESEAALREALTQETPAPTDKELSRRFGRKTASVRSKIKELGLTGPRRYRRDLATSLGRAASRAALVAERQLAREAARQARIAARIALAESKAARKAAAQAAREAKRAVTRVSKEIRVPKRRAPPPPAERTVDPGASVARLREAWGKVSAKRVQPTMDPAEAERRLLSILGTR